MIPHQPPAGDVQAAIERVRGVIASRVLASDGEINEIHILADARHSARQIVRDVQTLCITQYGLHIDQQQISVALIHQPAPRKTFTRPEVRGIRMETQGRQVTIYVAVGLGDRVVEGKAESTETSANRPRVAASAALDACEKYLNGQCRFVLEDLTPFHLGEWSGYLAAVTMVTAAMEERLIGSALNKGDDVSAAVKAACSAVNRRIEEVELRE